MSDLSSISILLLNPNDDLRDFLVKILCISIINAFPLKKLKDFPLALLNYFSCCIFQRGRYAIRNYFSVLGIFQHIRDFLDTSKFCRFISCSKEMKTIELNKIQT